jgi:hypothetical protein
VSVKNSTSGIAMNVLFPLGLGFIAFGLYEYGKYGLTEHIALLLFMGGLNIIYTLFKVARRAAR